MWSVEYVQVPDESNPKSDSSPLQSTMVDSKMKPLNGVDDSPSEEDSQSVESIGGSGVSTPRRDNMDAKSNADSLSEDFRDTLSVNSNVSSGRSSPVSRDDGEAATLQRLKPPATLPVAPPRRRKQDKMGSGSVSSSLGSSLGTSVGRDDADDIRGAGDMEDRDTISITSSIDSTPTVPENGGSMEDQRLDLGDASDGCAPPVSPSKDFILVTENDLKDFEDEEDMVDGMGRMRSGEHKEERSAAHRNKLKPGKTSSFPYRLSLTKINK